MNTHILSFTSPPRYRRGLIAAAGAVALGAFLYAGFQGAPNYSELAANREVEMHAARVPLKNFDELNNNSEAAIVGRVVAKGATRFLLPTGQPQAFAPAPAPSGLTPQKLEGLKDKPAAPARNNDNVITGPKGIPITQFTIEITRSMKGGLQVGQQIKIDQEGGDIEIPLGPGLPTVHRTIVAEHDPQLITGSEQVFFLHHGSDSAFRITGGPEGRFKIDAKRTLQPIDDSSVAGLEHKGKTLDELQDRLNSGGGRGLAS